MLTQEQEAWDALAASFPLAAKSFQPVYQMLRWEWARGHKEFYIPNEQQLVDAMNELLVFARDGELGKQKASSGGLCVWREGDEFGVSFQMDVVVDGNNIGDPPFGIAARVDAVARPAEASNV